MGQLSGVMSHLRFTGPKSAVLINFIVLQKAPEKEIWLSGAFIAYFIIAMIGSLKVYGRLLEAPSGW